MLDNDVTCNDGFTRIITFNRKSLFVWLEDIICYDQPSKT